MGAFDCRLLCGRCQLYRCSQIGNAAARKLVLDFGHVRCNADRRSPARMPSAGITALCGTERSTRCEPGS